MSWVTIEDLTSPPIRDNLKSPEITHFIYYLNEKPVPFTLKPSPIISFPEGPWDNMISGDVVFEIEEKHIVSETSKKDGVPTENIVDAAGITKQGNFMILVTCIRRYLNSRTLGFQNRPLCTGNFSCTLFRACS